MGQLTIREFLQLPDEEKRERYEELSSRDKFLWRTSYEPIAAQVVGRVEISEEEQRKARSSGRKI